MSLTFSVLEGSSPYTWVDRTDRLKKGTLRLTEDLDRHATLSCTVFASDGWSVEVGRQVKLEDSVDGAQFGGKVFARTMRAAGDGSTIEYDIVCASYERVCSQRVTGLRYYDSQTAKAIIQDLNENCLTAEGFTADANVATGPTIDHLEFNYATVSEALDALCRLCAGYYWYVDADKDIHFFERTTVPAPFAVSSGDALVGVTIKDSDEAYANRVNVLEDETGDTVTILQDDAAVDARSGLEGGTGYHEAVISIATGAEDPDALAQAFLDAHSEMARVSEVTIRTIGLHAGQLLTVALSEFGISDNYLIKSVILSDESGENRWTLALSDGSDIPDWLDAMRGQGAVSGGGAVPTVVLPESVTLGTITFDRDACEFEIPLTMPTAGVKPARLHVFAECPDASDIALADGSQAWDGTHAAVGFPDPVDCGYYGVTASSTRIKAKLPIAPVEDMTARVVVASATATAEQAYADAPSATVTIGPAAAGKSGSGVEYAPLVEGLTGTMHLEQVGADWFWWFDLAWTEPTAALDWPQVEGYDIVVWDPSVEDTFTNQCSLVSSEPAGKTLYTLPDMWRVPDAATAYKVYVRTRGTEGVNTIVPGVTPAVEFTPVPVLDSTGQEYADPVEDLACSWEYAIDPATGQPALKLTYTWTIPDDSRYGGAIFRLVRGSPAVEYTLTGIEPGESCVSYIEQMPAATETMYLRAYSVDQSNFINTYSAGVTPEVTLTVTPRATAQPLGHVTGFSVAATYTTDAKSGQKVLELTPTFTKPSDASWAWIEFWAKREDGNWYLLGFPDSDGAENKAIIAQLPASTYTWEFLAVSNDVNSRDRDGNVQTDPTSPPSGTPTASLSIAPPTGVSHVTGFSVTSAYSDADNNGKKTLKLTPAFTPPDDDSWAYIDFWAQRPDDSAWYLLGYPSKGGAVDVATIEQLPTAAGTWNFVAISHDVNGKDRDGNANSNPGSPPAGSPTTSLSISPPALGSSGQEYASLVTLPSCSLSYGVNGDGVEVWGFSAGWANPSDTRYAGIKLVARNTGTGADTPLGYTGPADTTLRTDQWPIIGGITYDVYFVSIDVNGRENTLVPGTTPRVQSLTPTLQTTGSLKGGRVDTGANGGPIVVKDSLGATFAEIGKIARGTSPETYYYGIRITGAAFTLVFDPTAGLTIDNTSAADEDRVALTDGYVAITQRDNADIKALLMSNDLLITSRRSDGMGGYLGATFHVSVTDGTYTLELLDADNNPILQATSTGVAVNALTIGGTATGGAALLDVGTGAGDVAAGNRGVTNGDSHDHSGGDGAQIAYSGLSGLPLVAEVNLTGQTAAIGTTTLVTPGANGMYRASIVLTCTTAGTGGVATGTLGFTDENGAQTYTPWASVALNAQGYNLNTVAIYAQSGAAITYAVAFSGTGTPQYSVHITLERIS